MKPLIGIISWFVLFFGFMVLCASDLIAENNVTFWGILGTVILMSALAGVLVALMDYARILDMLKSKKTITSIGDKYFIYDYELHEKYGDIGDNVFYWKECTVINIRVTNNREVVDVKTSDGEVKKGIRVTDLKTQKII